MLQRLKQYSTGARLCNVKFATLRLFTRSATATRVVSARRVLDCRAVSRPGVEMRRDTAGCAGLEADKNLTLTSGRLRVCQAFANRTPSMSVMMISSPD
jgi:hypothetical protein